MKGHERKFRCFQKGTYCYVTSFNVLENNNYIIGLVELVACDNKTDLYKRERFHIENTMCVNKIIIGRTHAEYDIDNADKISIRKQQYYKDNIDKYKQYNINNRDKIRARYCLNADKINARRRLKAKTIKDLLKIAVDAIVVI